ncbi:MAG TPA: MurT ligase domain-containing protein, partial [Candidatus Saccharimonadales bacterium]|nr:MurT ligase domain-containing protein [Candidatus Saccharimonadales bacterium]
MHKIIGTALGKTVRHLASLRGGGGQALPGLVVERLFPSYLGKMLAQLPEGIVIITGTNGKTTTTKMVVELLQANGKKVMTNPTGSNFTRGIISSLTHQAKLSGRLPFDVGVFELDEAYARQFVLQIKPRWVLALNVMRDQLDRFGELDTAANMIGATMHEALEGIITNNDDARLTAMAEMILHNHNKKGIYFGVHKNLRPFFPVDDELHGVSRPAPHHARSVELTAFKDQETAFRFGHGVHAAQLQLSGQHNFQNAAAALALVHELLPKIPPQTLVAQLATVKPAFGRGELFTLKNGATLQLILVKNPAGFRQSLASYLVADHDIMIAINDNYADGRDTSWLWDVPFDSLKNKPIALTSGTRAADMA